MDDWKEWPVLSSLEIIDPPVFLWPGEDEDGEVSEPTDVIQRHYNDVVGELRDGGYEHTVTLKKRLASHLSEVKERVRTWRGRVLNAKLQHRACRERLNKIAAEEAENPTGVEEKFNSLLSTPIGKQWLSDGEIKADPEGNWDVSRTHSSHSDTPLSRLNVKYEVTEEGLHHFGLPRGYSYDEFDSEAFQSYPVRRFSGDTTWESVFESLKKQLNLTREHENRATRTLELLRFRLSIVETVLYRYEAFCSDDEITEQRAQQIAEESKPGRRSTLNDPEAYPVVMLNAVLEWTENDANLERPFRSENQPSLCGHLSKVLEERAGYAVPQDTIKTRLQSLMSELGVELPHGHTNKRSYFEARDEIAEAVKKRGLSV